jgi:PEP-CTERM motif-containing protein
MNKIAQTGAFVIRRALVSIVLATAVVASSSASTVKVDYSGTLTTAIPSFFVGESFSGSFTYDTTAPVVVPGGNFTGYAMAPGAFSLTIGGNTVSNYNGNALFPDNFYVTNFGDFALTVNGATGSGPLNSPGTTIGVRFFGSNDPAFAAMTLPFPFPTDFTSSTIIFSTSLAGPSARGSITSFSATNTPAVPEPATWAMMLLGFAGLGFAACRRSRKSIGGFAALV